MEGMEYPAQIMNAPAQDNDLFQRSNDLKVIQEYNKEENMPSKVKNEFWALASKSIKLGFWDRQDEQDIYFMNNIINVGHIMGKPKHKYTFGERQQISMLKFLVYADFKRGVGMEKHKINERTLQASTITQNIQGSGSGARRGGVMASLSRIFG